MNWGQPILRQDKSISHHSYPNVKTYPENPSKLEVEGPSWDPLAIIANNRCEVVGLPNYLPRGNQIMLGKSQRCHEFPAFFLLNLSLLNFTCRNWRSARPTTAAHRALAMPRAWPLSPKIFQCAQLQMSRRGPQS